jgi:hypothetical protein
MEKSAGWESGKGKVGTLRNRIGDIVESGYQPVGVFSPGSHVQVDFNTMMPHALLGQFDPTDTTKKLIKQFDKEVKAAYPNWVGITHPKAEAQLMDKGNGVLRTQFTKTMGKDSYQSSGFPDVPSVRKAISDPELYNTELGTLGQNMALFDRTGALVEVPKNPSAYPLSMSAQNLGKLDQTENFADFFTTANERRRLMGSDPAGDYRSFELSQPIQYANEEWLNKLLESRRLRDEAIKKGGYAEGGSVNSPATYDPSLIDEIVNSIDEPRGYAEGGEVSGPDLEFREDPEALRLYKYAMKQAMPNKEDSMSSTGTGIRARVGGGDLNVGIDMNRMTQGQQDQLMKTLAANYDVKLGDANLSARVEKPLDAKDVYVGMINGSIPIGVGRAMLGVQGMKTPYGSDVLGYNVGYSGKVGPGRLSANVNMPKRGSKSASVQYQIPFAEGGSVSAYDADRVDAIANQFM